MAKHFFSRKLDITRPANTTAYTALDVVGTSTAAGGAVHVVNTGGGANGGFMIQGSEFRVDLTSVPAGMTSFRLYLYSATPPSALADNAAWDLPAGDVSVFLGYVDLGTPVDLGSTLYVQAINLNKTVNLSENATLYAYLQTTAGYTPASGTTMSLTLHAEGS